MATQHLKKGTLWTIAYFLGSFAKTIVLTPLMLSHWGESVFCIWAVLLSVRAVLLFLSDGFVRFSVNSYNLQFHTDEPAAERFLSGSFSFSTVFTLLISLTVFGIMSLQPQWCAAVFDLNKADVLNESLPLYLSLYLLMCGVQNGQRMYGAVKEARGQVWHNLVLEVSLVVLEIAILSALILRGGGFVHFLWADMLLIGIVTVAYQLYLRKMYPLQKWMHPDSLKSGARAFVGAGRLYAGNFFEKLSTDGLVLLLSLLRFPKQSVALYSTLRTMINAPLLAQNLLLNTYTPRLQQLFALKDAEHLRSLLLLARRYLGTLLLAGILVCIPLYEPVFLYWTRNALPFDGLFAAAMLGWCVWSAYGNGYLFAFKGLNQLSGFLRLMLLRCVLLIPALVWCAGDLWRLGGVLLLTEFIVSGIVTPWLLHGFWKQAGFSFRRREDFLLLFIHIFAVAFLFFFLI